MASLLNLLWVSCNVDTETFLMRSNGIEFPPPLIRRYPAWSDIPLHPNIQLQDCTWTCAAGYWKAGNKCLICSLYMQSQVAAGLSPPPPAVGGIWNNTAGSCNADSWACAPGFRRSPAGDRYCCPLSIAHASPAGPGGGGPCEVTCNAGFWWNVSAANCTACSGLPAEAEWLSSAAANGQVCFHHILNCIAPMAKFLFFVIVSSFLV